MELNGMNWEIRHVLASLARHHYKIPRCNVVDILKSFQHIIMINKEGEGNLKDHSTMSHVMALW
jgi:hypothetical protein